MTGVVSLLAARSGSAPAKPVSDRALEGREPPVHQRPRLQGWLSDATSARIVLLQAPAGFGKTAVLNMWAAGLRTTERCTVRVVCTGARTSVAELLRQLSRTLVQLRAPLALSQADAVDDDLVGAIIRQLDLLGRPIDLLVDEDSGRLSASCLSLLWGVALRASQVRVFVASRRNLMSGLARARIQGQVAVLEADGLALDKLEARALFGTFGITMREEPLATVIRHTGGWPLAVRMLAAASCDETDAARSSAVLFNRKELRDFFQEEVLDRLSRDGREFLEAVCIIERLCPSLCDAITGRTDGREMLQRLHEGGFFVLRTKEEDWCEIHPLLSAVLKALVAREPAEARRSRHLRACQWFDQNGRFIEAFRQAMQAEDHERAARVLNAHCDDLYMSGLEESILPIASSLPPDVRRRFPRIILAMSWRMMAEWRFDQARAHLNCARLRVEEMRRGGELGMPELGDLEFEIKHRQLMQHLFAEDFAYVTAGAEELLRDINHWNNPYIVMSIYAAMMYAHREQFQLGVLDRLEALGREMLPHVPGHYVHVLFECMVAPGKLLQGATDTAIALLERSLRMSVDEFAPSSPIGATVALPLSEARYARNELDAAQQLLDEYLPVATDAGFVDQLISGYLTQARLHRQRGDVDAALGTLQQAGRVAAERGFRRLEAMAFSERIALLCHADRPEEAVKLARAQGLKLSSPPAVPHKGSTRQDNAMALAWVRFASACGRIDVALSVSKAWRSFTSSAKAVASVVEWDILRAQLLLASHEKNGAVRALSQAVAIAAPARLIRPFVDEAVRLAPILEALARAPLSGQGAEKFLASVLEASALDHAAHGPVTELGELSEDFVAANLTSRELEILKLVAAGHLNAEIGRRLGLTPGTVKWYLHRVYGKLGCKRRIKAIEHARTLGLID